MAFKWSYDVYGKSIEKVLNVDQIILLNTGENTIINPHNGKFSDIDLSFSYAAIA